ncbi:MAG: bifunctional D-glycero-beta-D-manno-heptose-7-phosphate kinase/D-glycero-beta-D-manno-heptose 1-phosphate adenylyltransferase HldE [Pseudomonadota bacterium]|nr:bifunctional D-glycero-beta-D-manno-heptose-7-phosphate kinase/D-glycero-beta-D-manno-heptose 1-phosphate adenylyltransferase HldE [Pseudomonadota bacterium]
MTFNLPNFKAAKVLVIGDVMLDRYWYGATDRISPEAPVPVVHVNDMQERPGGAGNVALNLRALDCDVRLLGMVGDDDLGERLEGQLREQGIFCDLERVKSMPTISKLRIMGQHQQLIRLDFERSFHHVDPTSLLTQCRSHLPEAQLLILSDYGKGALAHVQSIIELANRLGITVLVDPKGRDFSRYHGATMLTPNLKEFEAVVGPCRTPRALAENGQALMNAHNLKALLVTQGENGMTLLQRDQEPLHIATKAQQVFDVTGAGDTVIATLGAAIAVGTPYEDAVRLANTAAGIVVRKLGSAAVTVPELRRAMQREMNSELGILTEQELLTSVADARAHDESIVMTNGCFDIIHAGHISYLQAAKALGKRLIIAVNDDASVARLKGAHRPINPLHHRMSVLAALRVVDWVVPFSEETPERLITRVLPDILVKGGDYAPDKIAGSRAVIANGGHVRVLPFVEGCSTSAMVKRIQEEETKCIS